VNCSSAALAFFLPTLGMACSSSSPPGRTNGSSAFEAGVTSVAVPGSDAASDAAVACDPSFHPDTIAPGLTKQGDAGALTFVLESADEVPPVPKYNDWILKLVDASGQPVKDATFPTITTWMPLHQHGSSVVPTWMSNGDGTYSTSVFLFMPGLWQVTFHAQSGMTSDRVTYTFCVGG
jgi:YtkA-like